MGNENIFQKISVMGCYHFVQSHFWFLRVLGMGKRKWALKMVLVRKEFSFKWFLHNQVTCVFFIILIDLNLFEGTTAVWEWIFQDRTLGSYIEVMYLLFCTLFLIILRFFYWWQTWICWADLIVGMIVKILPENIRKKCSQKPTKKNSREPLIQF